MITLSMCVFEGIRDGKDRIRDTFRKFVVVPLSFLLLRLPSASY